MPINANVSGGQQITASVGETKIDVSVSGGVGPSGASGTPGAAASVTVGTVTTGAPGSSASVVNAGSSSAAVLNFTIPAGATGATGPQGATGPAGTTTWAGITDKPSTFTPSSHQHVAADITDFTSAVIAAAPPTVDASLLTQGTLPDQRLSSNIARTSDVSAAVAAVVGAAPESLNTLQELSAALANDASFATTVTNSLASKAPINNPTFTGTVSGITASMVGLGNVPNVDATARANHTGTQTLSTISDAGTAASRNAPATGNASSSEVVLGSDTRLSDQRVPTDGSVTAAKLAANQSVQFSSVAARGGSLSVILNQNPFPAVFNVSSDGIVTAGTWQGTAIAVANGGTGATTASGARTNLGLAIGTDVAAASHTQAWSTITSTPTTLAGYGITDAVGSSDSRLSDARTPTAHKTSHATGGTDALTPADIGAAAQSHTHSALAITSDTLDIARLPTVLEQTVTVGNSGTSTTLSLTNGSVQTVTLNGNCTFTMPTAAAGASLTLILTQSGTFTASFTGVLWAGGTAPTITATNGKVDVLVFVSNGTSWFGTAAQNF